MCSPGAALCGPAARCPASPMSQCSRAATCPACVTLSASRKHIHTHPPIDTHPPAHTPEQGGGLLQHVVVHGARLLVEAVGHGLKVHRGRAHAALGGHEAVGQVPACGPGGPGRGEGSAAQRSSGQAASHAVQRALATAISRSRRGSWHPASRTHTSPKCSRPRDHTHTHTFSHTHPHRTVRQV